MTPPDIIAALNRQVRAALDAPDVKASMQKQGLDPAGGTAEEFGAYIKSELTKWSKVIRASGATAQ